ncbi:hypothetical protein [uncultured Campylobacter sp.]|uniref:hypothetical protein n=1 Tax=uncultured Campylobacter sp. TaxID=218934 RepID=UPI00262A206F|nr:hypothetical protein [uncultured Campylobacter sp.]
MSNKDKSKIEPLSTSESNKLEGKTDLKNVSDKSDLVEKRVMRMFKVCSLITSIFAVIGIITFIFSYMRYYGFFTYEVFSANHILLFAFFTLLIFLTILALYGSTIMYLYYSLSKDEYSEISKKFFVILATLVFFAMMITLCYTTNQENILIRFVYISNWIVGIILFISLIAYPRIRKFYNYIKDKNLCIRKFYNYIKDKNLFKKVLRWLSKFIFEPISKIEKDGRIWFIATVFGLIVVGYMMLLISYQNVFVSTYSGFLKFCGLADDSIEIYLKNENKSVRGKLIFDDGKYAYVEFNRTDSNCGGIGVACEQIIRKKVPSEDVSIFVSPEQQQDKKSAAKLQETKQSKAK